MKKRCIQRLFSIFLTGVMIFQSPMMILADDTGSIVGETETFDLDSEENTVEETTKETFAEESEQITAETETPASEFITEQETETASASEETELISEEESQTAEEE